MLHWENEPIISRDVPPTFETSLYAVINSTGFKKAYPVLHATPLASLHSAYGWPAAADAVRHWSKPAGPTPALAESFTDGHGPTELGKF